jgi:flotillin
LSLECFCDRTALAEGTQKLAESWLAAGSSARDIFLLQKLEVLLQTLSATVPTVEVQKVTVVDADNGSFTTKAAAMLEQLKQTTGIDLARTLSAAQRGNGQGVAISQIQPASTDSPSEQYNISDSQ